MNERDLLHKLYLEVFGTTKGNEIKEMFKTDIKKIRSQKDVLECYKKYEIYLTFGRALGTVKNVFNDFKKIINTTDKLKHKELLLEAFSLPNGYYYAINKASAKVVEQRKEEGANIEISVKEFNKLIRELYEKGMDKDISFWDKPLGSRQTKETIRAYFLATYLALVTGRRLTEILKTMELRKYKNKVKVKGILKKKGEEGDENTTYDLLVLDDVEKVISAYKELRKIFDCSNLTNRECNNKYNHIFNRFLKENILHNTTFHDLRAIYSEIAYGKFGKQIEELGKKEFIEDILLHHKEVKAVDFYLNRVKSH